MKKMGKKKTKKNNSFLRLEPELRAPISRCHAVHKSVKDYDRAAGKRLVRAEIERGCLIGN
jgi:hypothetical protein